MDDQATFQMAPLGATVGRFASRMTRKGDVFKLIDETGHVHASYKIGDYISPAPKGAIGVTFHRGEWFWIIKP